MPSKFGGIPLEKNNQSRFGGIPVEQERSHDEIMGDILNQYRDKSLSPEKVQLVDEIAKRGLVDRRKPHGVGGSFEKPTFGERVKNQLQTEWETLKNMGRIYPVAETAANLFSSAYGVPVSGLAGLLALPFGKGEEAVEMAQRMLIVQPKTEHGEDLLSQTTWPLEKLEQAGEFVGGKAEELGFPNVGAGIHSLIVGAPAIIGGRLGLKRSAQIRLTSEINQAIEKGINKGIRPSVRGKSTQAGTQTYKNKARTAVQEIVSNKENLNIIDETGMKVEGLPKTLDQFSQAIEQTKRLIFEEYDSLAKQADIIRPTRALKYPIKKGETIAFQGKHPYIQKPTVKIDLGSIGKNLKPVLKNKILQDLSPETIEYAKYRMSSLKERGAYTAVETQEAIQLLNQTLEKFYRDPSPEMKGKAFVDSMIANNLRKKLDTTINSATGKNYQALKNKYGALREIEKDVNHRSIVDARKNTKGLLDFSDVFTGYHIVRGMLSKDPMATSAGFISRIIKEYQKMKNDPNRIVKNMFEDVDNLTIKRSQIGPEDNMVSKAGIIVGAKLGENNE